MNLILAIRLITKCLAVLLCVACAAYLCFTDKSMWGSFLFAACLIYIIPVEYSPHDSEKKEIKIEGWSWFVPK